MSWCHTSKEENTTLNTLNFWVNYIRCGARDCAYGRLLWIRAIRHNALFELHWGGVSTLGERVHRRLSIHRKINLNTDSGWWDFYRGRCLFYIECTGISRLHKHSCVMHPGSTTSWNRFTTSNENMRGSIPAYGYDKIRNQRGITKLPSRAYPFDSVDMRLLTQVAISLLFFFCEYVCENIPKT